MRIEVDHNALTGDDLTQFVNNKLFPYFKKFKLSARSVNTFEYKIGEIFSELKNRMQSGYNLREEINRIDELLFRTHVEKHTIVRGIESRLSVCNKVEQSISEAMEKAEALWQSILQKAFEGKIPSETEIAKCKQKADYEAASVLLERIKQSRRDEIVVEKTKQKKPKPRRGEIIN